ncbi:MAG: DEAD/DEAH box helicase [Spirochaetota bacterium]
MNTCVYENSRFLAAIDADDVSYFYLMYLVRRCGAEDAGDRRFFIPEQNIIQFLLEFERYPHVRIAEDVYTHAARTMREHLPEGIIHDAKANASAHFFHNAKPYQAQHEAFVKCLTTNVQGIFYEMGLGKTLIMITVFRHLYVHRKCRRLIVLAPSSMIYAWEAEILKYSKEFTADDILVLSSQKKKHRRMFSIEKKIYIMTYDTWKIVACEYCHRARDANGTKKKRCAHCEASSLTEHLLERSTMLVCDEAHYLGNHRSQRSAITHANAPFCAYRYLLSGTPIRKSPVELFSLMRVLSPNIIGVPYSAFERSLRAATAEGAKYALDHVSVKRLLATQLAPYVMRRFKKDCLDLPEKTVTFLRYTHADTKFGERYARGVAALRKEMEHAHRVLDEGDPPEKKAPAPAYRSSEVIPYFLRALRELSAPFADNPRWAILDDHLANLVENGNEDVVLWSWRPRVIDFLCERYRKYGAIRIHGEYPPAGTDRNHERHRLIERFKHDDSCKVAVLSTLVMDTGITLINARSMIFCDITMQTVHHFQAEDRNHRIGQLKNTNNYYLEAIGTADEAACYVLEKDRTLNTSLFSKPDAVLMGKIHTALGI